MVIKNQIKTVLLLGLLTGLFLAVGSFFGKNGLLFALIFASVMNIGSYWFSDKIVLKMYRAKESKNKELNDMVKEIAKKAKIPSPKVYIVPSQNANAFATGRNYKHSAIAVTNGIMQILNKSELKGVIAHEMSHIKNRDTLIATIAATIAGVISYLAFMARWGAIFGGFGDRDNNLGELLVLAILTPIIALIIQLAISRSREFLADKTGAETIQDSSSLASALEKLENQHTPMRMGNKATSSLFIVNPFKAKNLMKLMSTHPSTKERVKKLRSMRF